MRKSIFLIEIVLCHMPDWQPGLGRIWGGGHGEQGRTLLLPGAGLGATPLV